MPKWNAQNAQGTFTAADKKRGLRRRHLSHLHVKWCEMMWTFGHAVKFFAQVSQVSQQMHEGSSPRSAEARPGSVTSHREIRTWKWNAGNEFTCRTGRTGRDGRTRDPGMSHLPELPDSWAVQIWSNLESWKVGEQPKNWMPGCIPEYSRLISLGTRLKMLWLCCCFLVLRHPWVKQWQFKNLRWHYTKLKESSLMKSGWDKKRCQTRPRSVMLIKGK